MGCSITSGKRKSAEYLPRRGPPHAGQRRPRKAKKGRNQSQKAKSERHARVVTMASNARKDRSNLRFAVRQRTRRLQLVPFRAVRALGYPGALRWPQGPPVDLRAKRTRNSSIGTLASNAVYNGSGRDSSEMIDVEAEQQ